MTEAEAQAFFAHDDVFTRQVKRINVLLLIVLAALILGPAIATWWVSRSLPVVSTVSVTNAQVIGETELCPGDLLVIEYDFAAKGAGVLIRDFTLWQLDPPPRTLIYSMSRRFILDGPIEQHLREAWIVPDFFYSHESATTEPLLPGHYRRYLAISSPSRSTVVSIASVDFIIRDNCNE